MLDLLGISNSSFEYDCEQRPVLPQCGRTGEVSTERGLPNATRGPTNIVEQPNTLKGHKMQLTFDILCRTDAPHFELPACTGEKASLFRVTADSRTADQEVSSRIRRIVNDGPRQWALLLKLAPDHGGNAAKPTDFSRSALVSCRQIIRTVAPDANFACWEHCLLAVRTESSSVDFSPVVNAMTVSRLWDEASGTLDSVLDAETIISKCEGIEKEAILYVHDSTDTPTGHGKLWKGLIFDLAGNTTEACRGFLDLVKLEFHWRAAWYLARSLSDTASRDSAAELLGYVLQCRPDFGPARRLAGALTPKTRPEQLASCHPTASGEALVMSRLIFAGDVVFDVGANAGQWTKQLLDVHKDVSIHAFEPARTTYEEFTARTKTLLLDSHASRIIPNNLALGRSEETRVFHHYPENSTMSTLYRRSEKAVGAIPTVKEEIETITLDSYCTRNGLPHVNFLKIDVEGAELDVLRGSSRMLKEGRIDFVQFEYGGTYLDAGTTLRQAFDYLGEFDYHLFLISANGLRHIRAFHQGLENYQYGNFLAAHDRLFGMLLGGGGNQIEIGPILEKYGITPRGIIHVGAHEGEELEKYRELGIRNTVLIEANPEVYQRLKEKVKHFSDVRTYHCAITDFDGTVDLHITNMDQSSSILSLADHAKIYPQISECETVSVPALTLDTLGHELRLGGELYNILSMDIQGAELSALEGASNLLSGVDLIYTEVNWKELYKGCALIDDIDSFLESRGFLRVATLSSFHPSWGDAIYVRKTLIEKRSAA